MRRYLVLAVLAAVVITSGIAFAQEQPFGGKFKVEGYAEYINFRGNDIHNSTWGGGILARYLFLEWLGLQTNFSFYSDVDTDTLGGKLSFTNWRLSLILHSYIPTTDDKLYVYGGGGLGYQFNDDIGSIEIDGALTGNVLAGVGYDITEILSLEAEVGYQFGNADVKNFTDSEIGLEAIFVRLGAGIKF